jgi:thymidine kinase
MTTSTVKTGFLELFIGPMYAGKTSKIIEIYKKCVFCEIPVVVINHAIDTRYHDTMLSSHDKIMIPCVQVNNIKDIWIEINYMTEIVKNADVILINEGQFFSDLYDVVIDMLNHNKKVYISGLDGDFERKKFGQILDLIPYCDKVTKLTSFCSICKNGTLGIFSKRITEEVTQTIVGSDNYLPVCRECFEKPNCKITTNNK